MVNAENSLHAVKSLHAECQTLEHIITTQLQSIQKDEDLNDRKLHDLRYKLKDIYFKMLFIHYDYCYIKDVESALWKYGFYMLIESCRSRLKACRKRTGEETSRNLLKELLLSFLNEASGFYQILLRKFFIYFHLPLPKYVDFLNHSPPQSDASTKALMPSYSPGGGNYIPVNDLLGDLDISGKSSSKKKKYIIRKDNSIPLLGKNEVAVGKPSCYRTLIYLGDLARYQGGLTDREQLGGFYVLAQQYYYQAYFFFPEDGRAFNQLGVLAAGGKSGVDSVYYYYRSFSAVRSSSSALDNVRALFDRNHQSFLRVRSEFSSFSENSERYCYLNNAMESKTFEDPRFMEELQNVFYCFCVSFLEFHSLILNKSGFEKAVNLYEDVLKLGTIILSACHHLAAASLLKIFSFLQNFMLKVFVINIISVHMLTVTQTSNRNHDASQTTSFLAMHMCIRFFLISVKNALVYFDSYHDLLVDDLRCLGIFVQWLLCQCEINATLLQGGLNAINTFYPSSASSAVLVEFLNRLSSIVESKTSISELMCDVRKKWICLYDRIGSGSKIQVPALPEDIILRGCLPFNTIHQVFTFPPAGFECWSALKTREELYEHRLARFVSCGWVMATLPTITFFVHNEESNMFEEFFQDPSKDQEQLLFKLRHKRRQFALSKEEKKRNQVMKAMAQSRLQLQVESLENQFKKQKRQRTSYNSATLFVIPQLECFLKCLRGVRELVEMKRFVVIVPLSVLKELDTLKKGCDKVNRCARDACRYIEEKLKTGDKWIRSQNIHESDGNSTHCGEADASNPGTPDDILNCCRFFLNHFTELLVGDDEFLSTKGYNVVESTGATAANKDLPLSDAKKEGGSPTCVRVQEETTNDQFIGMYNHTFAVILSDKAEGRHTEYTPQLVVESIFSFLHAVKHSS